MGRQGRRRGGPPRRGRWRRLVPALALAALVTTALPARVDADPPAVTLVPSATSIYFRKSVTFSGKAPPGARVELRADRSPFSRRHSRTVRRGVAGPDGSYGFQAAPTANTRFAVCVAGRGGACSPVVEVYVSSFAFSRPQFLRPNVLHLEVFFEAPRDHPWGGRRIFFYHRGPNDRRTRVVAIRRVRQLRPTVALAEANVTVRQRGFTSYCVQPRRYRVRLGPPMHRKRRHCPRSFPANERPLG